MKSLHNMITVIGWPGGGSVKHYVIIKGGSANPYGPLQRGGGGVKNLKNCLT